MGRPTAYRPWTKIFDLPRCNAFVASVRISGSSERYAGHFDAFKGRAVWVERADFDAEFLIVADSHFCLPLCYRSNSYLNHQTMKKHNFNAGPSILPEVVYEKTVRAILDFNGTGLSILSISHRSKEFDEVMACGDLLLRELPDIPLITTRSSSSAAAPAPTSSRCPPIPQHHSGYVNTGVWEEGDRCCYGCDRSRRPSSEESPTSPKASIIPADLDYLHITTNNTIYGTEYTADLDRRCP